MPESLLPFAFSVRVNATEALQDKIQVVIGRWDFDGHVDNYSSLRCYMSHPRAEHIGPDATADNWEGYGLMFSIPSVRGPLKFRGNVKDEPGCPLVQPPLWSGSWNFVPIPSVLPGQFNQRYTTTLNVTFNPTRFARLQPIRINQSTGQVLLGPATHYGSKPNRRGDRIPERYRDEFSFDGNSNWLPQGPRLTLAEPSRWTSILQRSFSGFIQEFNRVLVDTCTYRDYPEYLCHVEEHLNLKTCETYWEFSSPDPVALVTSIKDHLIQFGHGESGVRTYRLRDEEDSRRRHSHVVTIDAGAGREVVVYAKTNKRVRFEVRHRMVGPEAFALPVNDGTRARRHTAERWDALYTMLNTLSVDAAGLLNRLFTFLEQRQSTMPSPYTAQILAQRVLERFPDMSLGWDTLGMLARDGRIIASALPEAFQAPLRALLLGGVLQRHDGLPHNDYMVSPLYEAALHNLHYLFEPTMLPEPTMPPCRVRLPAQPSQQPRVRRAPDDPRRPRVRRFTPPADLT